MNICTIAVESEETLQNLQVPKKDLYLFVCSGNTCRSPMAAAIFNYYYGNDNRAAISAGLYADASPLSPNAAHALELAGISPPDHISQPVDTDMLNKAVQIIGITAAHADSLIWTYPQFASKITKMSMDISDPYGGDLAVYQACLEKIKEALFDMFGPAKTV
ncbi:MAG: low molecular weight protein arginine phosphatase [Clostridiales bacterium]|nr:low molecular weight protein arginine phosphatase [Clostridiales bacterium]